MSYRPSNYLQLDNYDIIERTSPGYCANACQVSYLDFPIAPGEKVIMYGNFQKGYLGMAGNSLIYNTSNYVINDPNLVNPGAITDWDWGTYAYDNTSTIPGNSELNLITYNLGTLYNEAFMFLVYNYTITYTNSINLRVYTSPDNSTWTQVYSITRSDTSWYTDALYTSTPFQYIQLRIYNSSSTSATNGFPVYIRALEVYAPLQTPPISLVNNTTQPIFNVGLRFFVYNGYYQVLEVIPIQ